MRINDVGWVLVNRWGDFVTEIRPNHFTIEEMRQAMAALGGIELKQCPVRLMPELMHGEQIGQFVIDAIVSMDLVSVDDGVVFVWDANADEQIGAAVKEALARITMDFDGGT